VPAVDHALIDDADIAELKAKILATDLSVSELVATAWASASTYRDSDKRGGANGARIRLFPQKDWNVNDPAVVAKVISSLEAVQAEFNSAQTGEKRVSLADLVVLGGSAAIEKAANAAGHNVTVDFSPGRTDASQEQTDIDTFAVIEPTADGFRNYFRSGDKRRPEVLLVDRSSLLGLTAPEMTVLVGGLRVLGANTANVTHGVLTSNHQVLTNDFFVNLLEIGTEWKASTDEHVYEGRHRASGEIKWTATAVDLAFGSNSQLRALAEVYASEDAGPKFVADFIGAWVKVMDSDRFDLR
jgi:catalase-peroxidase